MVYTLWNIYFKLFSFFNSTLSFTCWAWVFYSLSCATTSGACSHACHRAKNGLLHNTFLTSSVTSFTGFRMSASFCASTIADIAFISYIYRNFLCCAKNGLLKAYLYCYTNIRASLWTISPCSTSTATEAKHIEYVTHVKVHATAIKATATSATLLKSCMSKLVIV
ncbi:hypothetical protein SDC9_196813 [bioreactor metagenome]|uniref:Uncharacterized protein n=1 Tax=bioreactor metagenome TaxID=1076179 RepID=A0A645ID12_9ZZZZ